MERAEGACQAAPLSRAFSAPRFVRSESWGSAPGYLIFAPSALVSSSQVIQAILHIKNGDLILFNIPLIKTN